MWGKLRKKSLKMCKVNKHCLCCVNLFFFQEDQKWSLYYSGKVGLFFLLQKIKSIFLSQKYPRGFSLSKKTPSRGSSRVSSGSTNISLTSKTGVLGSSRTESLMSSAGIVSQRKKTSHLQQRVNSARRKSQNELVNSIAAMKRQIQVNSHQTYVFGDGFYYLDFVKQYNKMLYNNPLSIRKVK